MAPSSRRKYCCGCSTQRSNTRISLFTAASTGALQKRRLCPACRLERAESGHLRLDLENEREEQKNKRKQQREQHQQPRNLEEAEEHSLASPPVTPVYADVDAAAAGALPAPLATPSRDAEEEEGVSEPPCGGGSGASCSDWFNEEAYEHWVTKAFSDAPSEPLYSHKKTAKPREWTKAELLGEASREVPTLWRDSNGEVLAQVLPFGCPENPITRAQLELLRRAYRRLMAEFDKVFKSDNRRGNQEKPWSAVHLGCWVRFSQLSYPTKAMSQPALRAFFEEIRPIAACVAEALQRYAPRNFARLQEMAKRIPEDMRAGVYHAMALNKGFSSGHHDELDAIDNLCAVLAFSLETWTDGDLVLHDLKRSIPLRPGTLCFRSASNRLYHYNLAGTGERNSIVFIAHAEMVNCTRLSPPERYADVLQGKAKRQVSRAELGSVVAAEKQRKRARIAAQGSNGVNT